jgi:hypothetical protein
MARQSILIVLIWAAAACGQSFQMMQSTFTGGELSPTAAARIDAQRYYQSAATIENMIVSPQGPVIRRPGTRFAAATDSNNVARLLPFRYSVSDCYVLEFTHNTMRIFRNHGLVTNEDDSIYELATPFDEGELDHLQMWQTADVCFFVDGTDWPQKLVRTDHNDWDINDAAIDDGPFLPENLTGTTIEANAVTGDVNLVASAPIWTEEHEGSYWRLRDLVAEQTVSGTFADGPNDSNVLDCQDGGYFQWALSGTLHGEMQLQISYDSGGSWLPYTVATADGHLTATETVYSNDAGQDVQIRVAMTVGEVTDTVNYVLWTHAYMHTGVVKILDYNDPCTVTAHVVRTLASTAATVRWSEGAWSAKRGFPRAICGYSDRLVFASTTYQPVRIWMSATGNYETFDEGAGGDADSFAYTLARSEQDPILWLMSQRRRGLLAGTTGGVLELEPLDSALAITPSNPPTTGNILAVGASEVPPVVADSTVIMLQRNGRKLHEILYSYDSDSLVAPDLTLFADHVTAGGVTEMAWTSQPYTILWARRPDGQLLGLTHDHTYQIVGWHRHALGGSGAVESLCSVPGSSQDELWLSVRRTIDGQTVRYVEYLSDWDFGSDLHDAFFVDCGLTYDSAAATTFSGLGYLEGCTLAILADGGPIAGEVVSGGSVTLSDSASVVQAGLPFTSTLTTVRYDVTGQQGATWARRKTIPRVTLSVYQSLGATVGADAAHLQTPDWRVPGTPMLAGAMPLYTGDVEVGLPTSYGTDKCQVTIVQTQPLPLIVRAIVAQVEVR